MSENIYSVSQLNSAARQMLEGNFSQIWLTGEISNFTQPVSGHWYLTLKDENAQVRGAMFRMKNLRVGFRPQNGMQVLVRANVSLYEPRGDYQQKYKPRDTRPLVCFRNKKTLIIILHSFLSSL